MNSILNNSFLMPGGRLIRVANYQEAKDYPVPLNSEVPLFDENEDVLYIKRCDVNNFVTTTRFHLTAMEEEPQPQGDYVTSEEFISFKEEILNGQRSILEQLRNAAPTTTATTGVIDVEFVEQPAEPTNGSGTKKRNATSAKRK